MKRVLLSLLMTSCLALCAQPCDLPGMERQLVDIYGYSGREAHAFRLVFETFLTNLDIDGIRLKSPADQGDLSGIRQDLIAMGLTGQRADYLVKTIALVRLTMEEYGVLTADEACLGVGDRITKASR